MCCACDVLYSIAQEHSAEDDDSEDEEAPIVGCDRYVHVDNIHVHALVIHVRTRH